MVNRKLCGVKMGFVSCLALVFMWNVQLVAGGAPIDVLEEPLGVDDLAIACPFYLKECPHNGPFGTTDCNFQCSDHCPFEKPKVSCLVDPCSVVNTDDLNAACLADYPDATCEAYYCGGCHTIWYETSARKNIITCNDGCPLDKPQVLCFEDPCVANPIEDNVPGDCLASNPDAFCVSDYCGGCNAIYMIQPNNPKCLNCDIHTCDIPGQVFSYCASPCPLTCEPPGPCIKPCWFQCECPAHIPHLHNGECIADCDAPCPNNQLELLYMPCDEFVCKGECSTNGWCCVPSIYEAICEILEHLLRDYLGISDEHKKLIAALPDKDNTGKIRGLLDEIWDVLDCLFDMICDIKKYKEKLNPDGPINGVTFVATATTAKANVIGLQAPAFDLTEWLMKLIGKIFNKATALMDLLAKLEGQLSENNGTRDALLELRRLAISCVYVANYKPVAALLAVRNSDAAIQRTAAASMNKADLIDRVADNTARTKRQSEFLVSVESRPDLCRKVYELEKFAKRFLELFMMIRDLLEDVYFDNGFQDLFPYQLIYDLCACLFIDFRLVEELRYICENSTNSGQSSVEIAKLISDWLTKAMEVREKLRDCVGDISKKAVQKMIQKIPSESLEYGGKSLATKSVAKKVAKKISDWVADLLEKFDDCITKIQCLYIDYVREVL